MFAELSEAGKKMGLWINQTQPELMKDADGGKIKIDGTPVKENSSYVYLGRSINANNDMREEVVRRQKAALAASGPLKEVTNHLADPELQADLFDLTLLPALCLRSET
uniref:Lipoprotein n=1 Tax=Haemonchus contortus TaxID=6289 RepID=A0A7I4YY68_HAECO